MPVILVMIFAVQRGPLPPVFPSLMFVYCVQKNLGWEETHKENGTNSKANGGRVESSCLFVVFFWQRCVLCVVCHLMCNSCCWCLSSFRICLFLSLLADHLLFLVFFITSFGFSNCRASREREREEIRSHFSNLWTFSEKCKGREREKRRTT